MSALENLEAMRATLTWNCRMGKWIVYLPSPPSYEGDGITEVDDYPALAVSRAYVKWLEAGKKVPRVLTEEECRRADEECRQWRKEEAAKV